MSPDAQRPNPDEIRRRALQGSLWGIGMTLAGIPLSVASTVVAARALGSAGFGRYALISFVVPTVVSFSDLGLTNAMLQRAAVAFGRGDLNELESTSAQAITWFLFRVPVVWVALYFIVSDKVALACVAAAVLLSAVVAGVGVQLLATLRNAELSRVTMLATCTNATVTIVASISGASATRVFAFSYVAQALVLMLQVTIPSKEELRGCLRPRRITDKFEHLRFGAATFLSSQMGTIMTSRSELLFFLASQRTARGVYAAAYTIGQRLTLPLDALYGAVGTGLASASEREQSIKTASEYVLRLSSALFSILFAPALMLSALGATVLFPSSYHGIGLASVLLAAGALLITVGNPLLAIYFAQRRVRPLVASAAVGLGVNLTLSFVLVKSMGLEGAVIANAGSSVFWFLLVAAPLIRGGALTASVRAYVAVTSTTLLTATMLIAGTFEVAEPALRWSLMTVAALTQTVVTARVIPVLHAGDLEALRNHLPAAARRPVFRLFLWLGLA